VVVTTAVYYQSIEAIVALKFLGNMADTNNDFVLETCVLGGVCDGRTPATEPPVVEGAPPVPMVVRNQLIAVEGAPPDRSPVAAETYPLPGANQVYQNAVVKVFFSKPVRGLDAGAFTLTDSHGTVVPAWVDQIGAGAWGLFPNQILLNRGETYTARVKAGVCDLSGNCSRQDLVWRFAISKNAAQEAGNTAIPAGFTLGKHAVDPSSSAAMAKHAPDRSRKLASLER